MRKAITTLARLLDRVQNRFQRSRAGSVMILVVTLLVLMAIIGTAFLTTARNDRYSSQLHESNVQVDMLLEGIKNILLGRMAGEGFLDPNGQRWDDVHTDNWLASRTPAYMIDACGVWDATRTYNRGDWVSVISSLSPLSATFYVSATDNNAADKPGSDANWVLDPLATPISPCWESISSLFDLTPGLGVTAEDVRGSVGGNPAVFDGVRGRNLVRLVSVQVNGQSYPAFYFYRPGDPTANPPILGGFQTVLAASVSGNGIPDSFLWRLPMGEINGVTYYAAARVIDNNAAINLNTAGSNLYDFDAAGNLMPNLSFFPEDVGLAELLATFNLNATSDSTMSDPTRNEFAALNLYRNATGNLRPDGIIQMNSGGNGASAPPTGGVPVADFAGNREFRREFRYLSVADAQFMGLGRRIDYPGISGFVNNNPITYNNLSWSDSAALAYRFDLVNPETPQFSNGLGSASNVERLLPTSLWNQSYYSTQPWDPSVANYAQNWFNANYTYQIPALSGPITSNFNRRPLVVARNPQSNLMPLHVPEMDALRSVAFPLASEMGYTSDTSVSTRGNVPRVSLNTADPILGAPSQIAPRAFASNGVNLFAGLHQPTLWLGFYNAMLGGLEEPYTDNTFRSLPAYVPYTGQESLNLIYRDATGNLLRLAQQFRSSLRDPTGIGPFQPNRGPATPVEADAKTFLPPASELLLRSLIAAVNTADLRDNDDDVTSATIVDFPIVLNNAYVSTRLTVFGAEREPFITEVYVNNDNSQQPTTFTDGNGNSVANNVTGGLINANGYVAIELYNPYEIPISLNGWALASLHRAVPGVTPKAGVFYHPSYPGSTTAMAPKLIGAMPGPTFPVPGDTNLPVIPAHGFLVLENVNPSVNATEYRPWWIYATSKTTNTPPGAAADRANTTLYYYVPNLEQVLKDPADTESSGDELYLLRPRRANGQFIPQAFTGFFNEDPTGNPYNGVKPYSYLTDMVPVDSFDFCGISKTDTVQFQAWHYVRANTIFADTYTPARPSWKFVYRGHWDPSLRPLVTAPGCHEDGVATTVPWNAPNQKNAAPQDPWIGTPPTSLAGQPQDGMNTAPISIGLPDYASSYDNPYPGIPINNTGYGVEPNQPLPTSPFENGLNKNLNVQSGSGQFNAFPFGGYARNGDVLQTPFIGSYTITITDAKGDTYVVEMNPITADAGFADDNNYTYLRTSANPISPTNPVAGTKQYPLGLPAGRNYAGPPAVVVTSEANEEEIGRFAPLSSVDANPLNFLSNGVFPSDADATLHLFDTYGWCSRVFDYFSAIQTPNDDWLPHSQPEYYYQYDLTSGQYVTTGTVNPPPRPVANSVAAASSPDGAVEANAPVEGLININTAPWRVLSELPLFTLVPNSGAASSMLSNDVVIAQAIVRYRNTHGPFHSIFDLNRVVEPFAYSMNPPASFDSQRGPFFQSANGPPDATDYLAFQGVLAPSFPGFLNNPAADAARRPDGIMTDYNHRMAEVMKLSNLLTTRSDSFTIYIQVQGWRGAGTPGAQLVVQRRAAFIMDRSGSTRSVDAKANTTNQISVNIPTKIQTQ